MRIGEIIHNLQKCYAQVENLYETTTLKITVKRKRLNSLQKEIDDLENALTNEICEIIGRRIFENL